MNRYRRMLRVLPLILAVVAPLGCHKPAPTPDFARRDHREIEVLKSENDHLRKTMAAQAVDLEQLEAKRARLEKENARLTSEMARLQLQLLEREASYNALVDEMAAQRDTLDEAVLEVVRAKAKLRSIESRAEAASSITEAEIALKSLEESLAASDGQFGEDFQKAESLLRMSTSEFKKENYGGALYLAGQAQSQIWTIQNHIAHKHDHSQEPGEVLFDQPLPLKVLKRSHLRTGPSLQFQVKRTLDPGLLLVGYAYKDDWIRVRTEDGSRGWIFQILVGGR